MPVHTYHCEECDHEFDAHQAFSDDALTVCPDCGKKTLYKIYKPALVVFKGKGFYVTDSKSASSTLSSNSNHKTGSNGHEAGDNNNNKNEAAKSETKAAETNKSSS